MILPLACLFIVGAAVVIAYHLGVGDERRRQTQARVAADMRRAADAIAVMDALIEAADRETADVTGYLNLMASPEFDLVNSNGGIA